MKRSGQSLLELMIAIGVVTTSTIAAVTLIVRTITVGQESRLKTEAVNYAREGVEVMRMIRDSNWLRIDQNIKDGANLTEWNDSGRNRGFEQLAPNGTNYYVLTFDTLYGWRVLPCPGVTPCSTGVNVAYKIIRIIRAGGTSYATQGRPLCQAATCSSTRYERLVKVSQCSQTVTLARSNIPLLCLDVTSTVSWSGEGRTKSTVASTRLYNWR